MYVNSVYVEYIIKDINKIFNNIKGLVIMLKIDSRIVS